MELKDRIREAMEGAGLRQLQLAKATGKSSGAVSQWMDGTTKSLKAETASRIERATGYRADWIVTGNGERKVITAPSPSQSSAIATTPSQPVGREPNFPKFPDGEICKEISVYSLLSTLAEELQDVEPAKRKSVSALLDALINNPTDTSLVAALTSLMEPLPEQIPKKKAHA